MKINGVSALDEQAVGDVYHMRFASDVEVEPPFAVTTDEGDPVYVVDQYTRPVDKRVDLQTGECTVTYRRPTELEAEVEQLRLQAAADAEYIDMLEEVLGGE